MEEKCESKEIGKKCKYKINVINNLSDADLFKLLDEIGYDKEIQEIVELEEIDNKNVKKEEMCTNCNTTDQIVEDMSQGIMVCKGCGTVMSNIINETAEWRQYNSEYGKETIARCSNTTNFFLPQSSLGTTMACSNRSRIKKLHSWSAMPYKERSLLIVLKEIQYRCRSANILKCMEDDAKILYKNISECKHIEGKNIGKTIIIRGANRKSLIAACVFFACKRKGKTRSPKEIAKIFELKYKDITKGCKTFNKLIQIKKTIKDNKISEPEDFIPRYCRDLHINIKYIEETVKIAKNIKKLNIASMHTPFSIATGSILLVADINKLQINVKYIANKFDVSGVTISKTFKKIEQYKNILIRDDLTNKLVNMLEEERKKLKIPEKLKKIYNKLNNISTDADLATNIQIKIENLTTNNEIEKIIQETNDEYEKILKLIKNPLGIKIN